MSTSSSGAGTPGAPTPATPALTAADVRAWLVLRGVAAADMDDLDIRRDIMSLEGAMTDRQLRQTLVWIRNKLVAAGKPAVDPTGVTIASLQAEIAAATAAMASPVPSAPRPNSRVWLAVFWCLGAFSWALTKIRSAGRRAVTGIGSTARAIGRGIGWGFSSAGRAIGRRWKPLLGVILFAGLVFGGLKGYQWWQTRALAAAPTPLAPAVPPPPVAVTPTPTPPVVVAPAPEPPPRLDLECVMYARLQSCKVLPPGCTEGFVTNPARLQVTCPGGIVYIDNRSMIEYPAKKRVSVRLHRQ